MPPTLFHGGCVGPVFDNDFDFVLGKFPPLEPIPNDDFSKPVGESGHLELFHGPQKQGF